MIYVHPWRRTLLEADRTFFHCTRLTTVEDIERVRKELGIEKWLVFGGSWLVPTPAA